MALDLALGQICAGVDGWDIVLVGPVIDDVVRLTSLMGATSGADDVLAKDAAELAALLGAGVLARVSPGLPHFREIAWWHREAQILALVSGDVDATAPVTPSTVFAAEPTPPASDRRSSSDAAALTTYLTAWLTTALREGSDLLVEPVAPIAGQQDPDAPTPFVRCWIGEGRLFVKVSPVPAGPDWTPFAHTDFALTAIDHDVADPYAQDPDALGGVAAAVADAALGWGIGALGVIATLDLTAGNDTDRSGDTLAVESPRALVAMLEEWLTAHADMPDVTLGASSGLGRITLQHPHLTIDLDVTATPTGVRFWLDRWYGSPHLALVPDPAQAPADVARDGLRCVVTVGQWLHAVDGCVLTATLTEHAPAELRSWAEDPRTPWWLGAAPGRVDYTQPNWFRGTLPRSLAILDDLVAYLPGATLEARTLRHLQVVARSNGERCELADLDVRLEVAAASRDVASGAAHSVPALNENFLLRLTAEQLGSLRDRTVALVERALVEHTPTEAGDVCDVHFDDRTAVVRTWRELLHLGVPADAARLFAELLVDAEERDVDDRLDFARTATEIVLTFDGTPWLTATDAAAHSDEASEAGGLRRLAVQLLSARISPQQAPGS